MAVEYDPMTGLPKQQAQQTNTGYGAPQFATSTAGTSGTTGYGGTAAGGTAGGGGATSWQQFLANDPFWRQMNSDISAQGISDEAQAKAQTQREIIKFGEAPSDLTGQAASWIDETTRQLAAQNTQAGTSQLARVNKFNTDRIREIKNQLAARGALRSSELGHQLNENQQAYTNAQYDQRTALTDSLGQIQSAYAAGQRAAQMARANALGQVANNYYQQPAPAAAPATYTGAPNTGGEGTPIVSPHIQNLYDISRRRSDELFGL